MQVGSQKPEPSSRPNFVSPVPLAGVYNVCVYEQQGNAKLPGIMAVGYIAAFSETLALAVIVSKGVAPLKDVSVRFSKARV